MHQLILQVSRFNYFWVFGMLLQHKECYKHLLQYRSSVVKSINYTSYIIFNRLMNQWKDRSQVIETRPQGIIKLDIWIWKN